MQKSWVLAVVSALFVQACRLSTQGETSQVQGFIGALDHIKPFTTMRSATEISKVRYALIAPHVAQSVIMTASAQKSALRGSLFRQINAIKGMPREQVKAVLDSLLSSKSTSCAGLSCARVFGLETEEIDGFLDESLEIIRKQQLKNEEQKEAAALLTASLLPADESVSGSKWIITIVPDPDSDLWKVKTPYSAGLSPDFPLKPGEGSAISMTPDLTAVVKWGPKQDEQLAAWKKIFDEVDDCATRGVKRGKVYATFNDCLAEATLEEQQFLSAKLVHTDVETYLNKVDADVSPRKDFRAVLDKDGNMQCLVVTHRTPSLSFYNEHYKGAIPAHAVQIPAVEVAYLLAAPWNLIQNHPKKVKGSGTVCLGVAALESKRSPWGGRILLEGSPSAVPYYKKLGFTAIGETYDERYGSLPVMWLEPKDAEKLIPAPLR